MKKKLAIISSYNELCGNATYSKVLTEEFEKYYDVTILPLNVRLLNNNNRYMKRVANKHIMDISSRLKEFDYVNIQFEAGLFGVYPKDIIKRMKILMNASNNLIITLHRLDIKKSIFDKEFIKDIFMNFGFKRSLRQIKQNSFARIYKEIINFCKKYRKGQTSFMVHTKREKELMNLVYSIQNVYDHPITFLNRNIRAVYSQANTRKDIEGKFGFNKNDLLIGIFGFISSYKGYNTIINALNYLPKNYKLIIFGSQHPHSVQVFNEISKDIDDIIQIIGDNNLKDRIVFAGTLKDDDFIKALYACDFTVLPYIETNQSASGIAALTLETKVKVLFSNNYTFRELARYYPGAFETFDIGNYLELADKILNYKYDFSGKLEMFYEKYNLETNIELYKSIFEKNEQGVEIES
ncbi:glycosyltransferase [bacterium]